MMDTEGLHGEELLDALIGPPDHEGDDDDDAHAAPPLRQHMPGWDRIRVQPPLPKCEDCGKNMRRDTEYDRCWSCYVAATELCDTCEERRYDPEEYDQCWQCARRGRYFD